MGFGTPFLLDLFIFWWRVGTREYAYVEDGVIVKWFITLIVIYLCLTKSKVGGISFIYSSYQLDLVLIRSTL